jgi:hypothetical protein
MLRFSTFGYSKLLFLSASIALPHPDPLQYGLCSAIAASRRREKGPGDKVIFASLRKTAEITTKTPH